MEILLVILGVLALLVGLAGAVLPLPGPPLSFLGLLLLHWSGRATFSSTTLIVLGIVTFIIAILDYLVPIWGVRKFGGTTYGTYGTTIGLILGLILPIPGGMFVGAFVGAMGGEMYGGMASGKAMRAAFGSFLGFMAGMFMKVVLCLVMIGYAIAAFIK
ncbi:hypothetical protein BWI93_18870 [Siphonobacter sp. BAB-5385]|uniref:DUF456 domain-containing protein n=1 Tax=Siphonobacter sp. BAB-5385 TaxID=1864822 RepID=UPI000B9EECE8|nr:DUF456 domain-containing protein [Siphonobacter sp. BAB-5385]OZI06711.1 hypothetical protein BWI93_18870 [Siphonobacter sp. BAB-5385]